MLTERTSAGAKQLEEAPAGFCKPETNSFIPEEPRSILANPASRSIVFFSFAEVTILSASFWQVIDFAKRYMYVVFSEEDLMDL